MSFVPQTQWLLNHDFVQEWIQKVKLSDVPTILIKLEQDTGRILCFDPNNFVVGRRDYVKAFVQALASKLEKERNCTVRVDVQHENGVWTKDVYKNGVLDL